MEIISFSCFSVSWQHASEQFEVFKLCAFIDFQRAFHHCLKLLEKRRKTPLQHVHTFKKFTNHFSAITLWKELISEQTCIMLRRENQQKDKKKVKKKNPNIFYVLNLKTSLDGWGNKVFLLSNALVIYRRTSTRNKVSLSRGNGKSLRPPSRGKSVFCWHGFVDVLVGLFLWVL